MAISATEVRALGPAASRKDRVAAGKALRRLVPRSSHARWEPPRDRADPVELLQRSDRERVASLLPIRYGRMSLSPFAFFRGSAAVMAADLATTPTTHLRVQLGGDAHLSNFGLFATPERDQVFDVNDFDETLPGPWEWDVKRLAASLVVAAAGAGAPASVGMRAARRAARSYQRWIAHLAGLTYLEAWYSHIDVANLPTPVDRSARRMIREQIGAARFRTMMHVFPKMVHRVEGRYRIRDDPPLIRHYESRSDAEEARTFFDRYLAGLPDERRMLLDRYRVQDVAQKVVGVGSVGTVCSVMLLTADRDTVDPIFLQLKEAQTSVLEPHAGASVYPNHAQRVVVGQHMIQEASDIFLGFSRLGARDFYFRQLRDMKLSTDVATSGPRALIGQAELCGAALARAHGRTGDAAMIAGYLGRGTVFEEAIGRFGRAYAEQARRDHAVLVRAIRSGRVKARVDV